ncbi:MAG: OmpA family protein [Elusimicrobiota bacterium]|nr:OmpA family protein [Elusimicrobiota bacterium]
MKKFICFNCNGGGNKKSLVSLVFCFFFFFSLFFAANKSFGYDFSDFVTAIADNGFDINLLDYENHMVMTSGITNIGATGTIRGRTSGYSILDGQGLGLDNQGVGYVAFGGVGVATITLSGNFLFHNFTKTIMRNQNKSYMFLNSSVTFLNNVAPVPGASTSQMDSLIFAPNAYANSGAMSILASSISFKNNGYNTDVNGRTFGSLIFLYSGASGGGTRLKISSSVVNFEGNTAGNATYMESMISSDINPQFDFYKSSISFVNNIGGAISIFSGGRVDIQKTYLMFKGNSNGIYNTYTAAMGGAVVIISDIFSLESSTADFQNNLYLDNGGANYKYGGAAFFIQGIAMSSWAHFKTENSYLNFTSNTSVFENGGAMSFYSANAEIFKSTLAFQFNAAMKNGGAIQVFSDAPASFHISPRVLINKSSLSFIQNTAKNGGAIYVGHTQAEYQLSFDGSSAVFTNNTAISSGGALFLGRINVQIFNSQIKFAGNTANSGGAIFMDNSVFISTNSNIRFDRNTASIGGAIALSNKSSMTFTKKSSISFENNYADISGGAISLLNSRLYFTDIEIPFINNSAANMGGALFADPSSFVFTKTKTRWIVNKASFGGAIAVYDKSTGVFANSTATFTENTALSFGGVFYVADNSILKIDESSLTFTKDITEGFGGGAIALSNKGSVIFAKSSLTFNANSALNGSGGVFHINNFAKADFVNISAIFIDNTAKDFGGVFYAGVDSNIIFTGSKVSFMDNTARDYGGAFYLTQSSAVFDKTTASWTNNTARDYGGAIYSGANSNLKVEDSVLSFINNNVERNFGGAIYTGGNSIALFTNSKVVFNKNTVGNGSGGAIYADSLSPVSFVNTKVTFEKNTARDFGGAIYADADSKITFADSDVLFIDNTARDDFGGAIYANLSDIDFKSSTVSFVNNTGRYGGGGIALNGATADFSNTTIVFANNTTRDFGGAIYGSGNAVFTFTNSKASFISNKVQQFGGSGIVGSAGGGAIALENSKIIINGAEFSSNESDNLGGAVYFSNSTGIFTDTDFKYNKSAVRGGAFYITAGKAEIKAENKDVFFTQNSANGVGNDFHLDNGSQVEFTADASRKIVLDGGITYGQTGIAGKNSSIVKKGAGDVIINGAALRVNGDSLIELFVEEGNLIFTGAKRLPFSADFELLDLKQDTTLGILVDFENGGATSLHAQTIIIRDGAVALSIETAPQVSEPSEGQTIDFLYANNTDEPDTFLNAASIINRNYEYEFLWREGDTTIYSGAIYNYIGYLVLKSTNVNAFASPMPLGGDGIGGYSNLTPQQQYFAKVFYVNLKALPTRLFWDYGPLSAGKRIYLGDKQMLKEKGRSNNFWVMGDVFALSNKISGIENGFEVSGAGAQAGYDLFDDGGLFVSYQEMTAKEDIFEASVNNMEAGLYKTWKASSFITNVMVSYGKQNFDVDINGEKAKFETDTIKFSLESEIISAAANISFFAGARGGYTMAGDIKDSADAIVVEKGDYFRADILGGLKKSFRVDESFTWGGKIYIGMPMTKDSQEPSFEVSADGGEKISGGNIGKIFGGVGIKGNYDISGRISLFAGATAEIYEYSDIYSAYLGASIKFGKVAQPEIVANKTGDIDYADRMGPLTDEEMIEDAKVRRQNAVMSFKLSAALFDSDSSKLSKQAKADIERIAKDLKKFKITKITIEGHTDSTGRESWNRVLSKNRAESVFWELIENGVPSGSMNYLGFAHIMPVATNKTEVGKQLNRRVEIFIEGERLAYDKDTDSYIDAALENAKANTAGGRGSAELEGIESISEVKGVAELPKPISASPEAAALAITNASLEQASVVASADSQKVSQSKSNTDKKVTSKKAAEKAKTSVKSKSVAKTSKKGKSAGRKR